ncbi:ADP-ribosylglycohydrolase (plasmid) [Halalkaliarchaeum sp. AArc-CO]|uniref:ADP-ribosylglycohydrolase family protein n=1 Tax=Halalkaliarchaeum sp. AArc-CO TaxID=2866381 RepID=UPI00217CCC7D|nr:ADP-ribosylglycohydrolase family protein [Halalkaliarchaeum sp. AArc-CO]UWG49294.1 ADP-ribosylglycohydrolase [Halalkaliarchaeum sp. AArc-CO]
MDTERAMGVILGLACGDALGRPVEFRSADQITAEYGELTEMVGHGTWNQPAGTITDDTAQALCIARSLAEQGTFDPDDIADRFVQWYESDPFDIGTMTRRALQQIAQGDDWETAGQAVWEASPEGSNAGNGSVMRCPPLAIAYAEDRPRLAEVSRQSSQITHADPRCTDGCVIVTDTIARIAAGEERPLASVLADRREDLSRELVAALEPVAAGETPTLSTSGYVVDTVQTALHDALQASAFEDAIVTAVNRGGDTDTIGAVVGAVAGARFGAEGVPDRWVTEIDEVAELRQLGSTLAAESFV